MKSLRPLIRILIRIARFVGYILLAAYLVGVGLSAMLMAAITAQHFISGNLPLMGLSGSLLVFILVMLGILLSAFTTSQKR